ncbi:SDR family NAD(P)-dependent oxidoreductase [Caldibacillus lycopersici]|uniref:SDR family NAD(P)-dependent oxidoreductase n=1 Tax=Perspicuibacillus lycopersici TaxID=1325689 RepID=A0AAE3IPI2_9BACI|nr:SDR family NAD(P)-dependent oxidoreductase [Perspicuibacillus lycopersici]MCU9612001.1 SDR family NAD(P)-dependent oxidoreductase [Perspicuibacillus lycopersici]
MKISGNTVLITGGASGIGLALAERFLQNENEVIIVGRRQEKLAEVKEKYPQIHTRKCDIASTTERTALYEWIKSDFPNTNVLINNAGIQQQVNLLKAPYDWNYYQKEISINIEGPIHLSMLFIPHLITKSNATIINISSGLAIRPGVWVPIYSATKAAIHSFTVSLRHQLANTTIGVIEVFPPAVNTDLGGVGIHTSGAPLADFADSVFHRIKTGDIEIGYGDSEKRLHASKDEIDHGTKVAWESFLGKNPNF